MTKLEWRKLNRSERVCRRKKMVKCILWTNLFKQLKEIHKEIEPKLKEMIKASDAMDSIGNIRGLENQGYSCTSSLRIASIGSIDRVNLAQENETFAFALDKGMQKAESEGETAVMQELKD